MLNKVIKDAKIKYEKKLIEQKINNSKQLWNFINTKVGRKTKKLKSLIL